MGKRILVGTRGSALAIAQTKLITEQIKLHHPELDFELVPIKTKGDVLLNTKLDLIGGKGLFVSEIEQALLNGKIDMAVHSMKDMPVDMPDELAIAAVSRREDPRDVLVTRGDRKLKELRPGAVIGTSSARRELQLKSLREDLVIKQLRGNVITRLDKLAAGEYDGIILAAAGLNRLGMGSQRLEYFEVAQMIPSIGQGILGIQTKKSSELRSLLIEIEDAQSRLQLLAERSLMEKLNGGCSTPIAAHAVIEGEQMILHGFYATKEDGISVRACMSMEKQKAAHLGEALALKLLAMREEIREGGR